MDLSYGFVGLGLMMVLIGVILVYMSLKSGSGEVKKGGVGVIFIGPISIVMSSDIRWFLILLVISTAIIMLMVSGLMGSNLVGW